MRPVKSGQAKTWLAGPLAPALCYTSNHASLVKYFWTRNTSTFSCNTSIFSCNRALGTTSGRHSTDSSSISSPFKADLTNSSSKNYLNITENNMYNKKYMIFMDYTLILQMSFKRITFPVSLDISCYTNFLLAFIRSRATTFSFSSTGNLHCWGKCLKSS